MISLLGFALAAFCSCFIGMGFNPIHYFISRNNRTRYALAGVGSYVLFRVVQGFATGTFLYVSVIATYLTYLICIAISFKSSSFILNSLVFYFITNTVCFFEMSGAVFSLPSYMGGFAVYTPDISGYFACMIAGLPYLLRGLIACFICYIIELFLVRFKAFSFLKQERQKGFYLI